MDRENVIKLLSDCRIKSCAMGLNGAFFTVEVIDSIITLLKEQDAVEPFHRCIGKDFSIILIEDSHFDYCPYCGRPITWAKQEGR